MSSMNRQIRDALVSLLAKIDTANGYPISVEEVSVVQRNHEQVGKFPHLIVEFPVETKKQQQAGWVRCAVTVVVTGYLRGKDHDARQDDLAVAVEQAVAADPTLGGLAIDSFIEERAVSSSWLQGYGIIELTGKIIYHHPAGNP